jgi:S-adenosylmethionine:tRNA ribosyltransferase-isomerase
VKRAELIFERPERLEATVPPEERGAGRDDVRLLFTSSAGHSHHRFADLPELLRPGDVLVANDSATLPASLPASAASGEFTLNLSTRYGPAVWLAEPRRSQSEPGALPLAADESIHVAGLPARLIAPYPGLPDLWFIHLSGDIAQAMAGHGRPIRYGYVARNYPLDAYQTIFARVPGSAEMPSAARPFTPAILAAMRQRGVEIVTLTLHCGVSSQEVDAEDVEDSKLYPEPFIVPRPTAEAVSAALRARRRVIALGTTVVKALESAWDGGQVRAMRGFTRLYIHPGREIHAVSGLLTGFHDPVTSHLALLYAVAGQETIRGAYRQAIEQGYLWHEFGDSHLILIDAPESARVQT